ncbi:hypothetical protein ACIF8W_35215 [Streptomyces sp. NPDC085639]
MGEIKDAIVRPKRPPPACATDSAGRRTPTTRLATVNRITVPSMIGNGPT